MTWLFIAFLAGLLTGWLLRATVNYDPWLLVALVIGLAAGWLLRATIFSDPFDF